MLLHLYYVINQIILDRLNYRTNVCGICPVNRSVTVVRAFIQLMSAVLALDHRNTENYTYIWWSFYFGAIDIGGLVRVKSPKLIKGPKLGRLSIVG